MEKWNKSISRLGLVSILAILVATVLAPLSLGAGGTSTVTGQVTVNNACAFTENVAGVTYGGAGGMTEGANTLANSNSVAVTDTGDASSNILINGASTTWSSGGNNFYVENTIYSSASHSYFVYPANTYSAANAANGNVIALTGVQQDSMITVNTVSANTFFTGLNIPLNQAAGTYTITIDITSSC